MNKIDKNITPTENKTPPSRHTVNPKNYNDIDTMKLTSKNKRSADGKVANEFTKEQASEVLAIGLLAGGSSGTTPVVAGTTEDLGFVVPPPSD